MHRGPYIQRGRGFGSTLSSMFKGVIPALQLFGEKVMTSPITQNILKTAKRSALEAGLNVARDTLGGKNLKESLSENVTTAKKAVTESLLSALDKAKVSNVGLEKKPVKKRRGVKLLSSKVGGKKSRKKKYADLFEETFS
jgi:hypothetical protein